MTTPDGVGNLPHRAIPLDPKGTQLPLHNPLHTPLGALSTSDLLLQLCPEMSFQLPSRNDVSASYRRSQDLSSFVLLPAMLVLSDLAVSTDRLKPSTDRVPEIEARPVHPSSRMSLLRMCAHLAQLLLRTRTQFSIKCQVQWSILIGKGRLSLPLKTSY